MPDPRCAGLQDDMRPLMVAKAEAGEAFALATIVDATGGPRPVGSQLIIDAEQHLGFLSGGCIEADVALHGREVLAHGDPKTLIYGEGSPFIDMRLPCGGRLEILVEAVASDDPALTTLIALTQARRPARWQSDGLRRQCGPADAASPRRQPGEADILYLPYQRLLVVGADPYAQAIAELGRLMAWQVDMIAAGQQAKLKAYQPDPWTAIAVATHEMDADHEALVEALATGAGYVGVLGARRRLAQRLAALRAAGVGEDDLGRLRAPIGLPLGATNAREVAVSVVAEIIAAARKQT